MNWYVNKYSHCGVSWEDEWDCECNDRCPECNKEITPHTSEEVEGPDPDTLKAIQDFKVLPYV